MSLFFVAFGAMASAVLISNVHAFEGTPAGFRFENGEIVDVDPWAAFFNPSFLVTAGHTALTAYTTGAFVVAAVKLQHDYKTGVAGLYRYVENQHPKFWKKNKKKWDEVFSKADINYHIDIRIIDFGSKGGTK